MRHVEALSFERYTEAGRRQARQYLTATLRQWGWTVAQQAFSDGGVNLVATPPKAAVTTGTILVVAHYDTVAHSPGADDNATGVAAALEIAHLLGRQATARQLQIVFFDHEEIGLRGSLAFTSRADNLTGVQGVLNLEMLGYACHQPGCQHYPQGLPVTPLSDRGDFLAAVGDQGHLPLLNALLAEGHTDGLTVLPLPIPFKGLLTPDVLRSDHAPFWANNIGAVMVTDTANFRNPHYHQPSDTPQTLDTTFFTQAAQRTLSSTAALLNSQGSLATQPPA